MEINNIFYGILLYIIIIASLVFIKPNFIYDQNENKYKEFGTTSDKTIFTLPVISIVLAIMISVIFAVMAKSSSKQDNTKLTQNQNIQYVPVQWFQPGMTTMPTVPQYQFVCDPRIMSSSLSSIASPASTTSLVSSTINNVT